MNTEATSTSQIADNIRANRSWSLWFRANRLRVILISALALFVILAVYVQATFVSGREFNARTWEIRQFSFLRDPFTNVQLSGVVRSAPEYIRFWSSNSAETVAELDASILSHFTTDTGIQDRWDLININDLGPVDSDARILVDLLYATNSENDEYWKIWTSNHSTKAAIFWPAAQQLVRFELYAALPSLFEAGTSEMTDDQFNSVTSRVVQDALINYCAKLDGTSKKHLIRSVASVGLTFGDHPELEKLANTDN